MHAQCAEGDTRDWARRLRTVCLGLEAVLRRGWAAGARLVDMVVPPHALVEAAGKLRLHAVYYITKQIIPALERVLNLVGADPRAWFTAMSRPHRLLPQKRPPAALPIADPGQPGSSLGTIDQYYLSRHCAVRAAPARPCSSSTMPVTAASSEPHSVCGSPHLLTVLAVGPDLAGPLCIRAGVMAVHATGVRRADACSSAAVRGVPTEPSASSSSVGRQGQ